MTTGSVNVRNVLADDLGTLVSLENRSFAVDRLSRRSLRHWIKVEDRVFLVAVAGSRVVGYVLVIFHRGTRLARLYSLAVDEGFRGQGIARQLVREAEAAAREHGRFFLRLEVGTENSTALRLYESLGYRRFGIYREYYQDHTDAIRMQKRIRYLEAQAHHAKMVWIRQTLPFTCGPASLMMAMRAISDAYEPSRHEEIQIWREATTVFMTSGHGGCHPVGLALSARARGFGAEVWISQTGPLFVDSVRSDAKKRVIEIVHEDFLQQAGGQRIPVHVGNVTQQALVEAITEGRIPLVLISTYRMDRKKAPHWVAVSGFDEDCLYVHDPDPDPSAQGALDCQYLPIARDDFDRISLFGKSRLRAAVFVGNNGAMRGLC